jgi:Cu(I)/Ag(I) efflux system membrane fusion protein
MSLNLGRRDLGIALVALILAAVGLFFQHTRHGWPFSLHHGLGVTPLAPAASHPTAVSPAPAHPRATVELEPNRLAAIGIRTELVRRESLARPVRTVATVVPDEARVSHVHTRVAGWIEKLHVNTTGQRVRAGQPLAGIYSQDLLASQNEFLAARRMTSLGPASVVVEGARARLKVFGMTDAEIRAIEKSGEARRLVTVSAPRSGVVLHRGISVGTAVDPSTELLTIVDLSHVWVLAEVPEFDIPSVQPGTLASLDFPSSGQPPIERPVEFLYPTLSERTRTLRVRFSVLNPTGALRPGLYGTAEFKVHPRDALTIPRDAIVDTGIAQHVFVAVDAGHFEPRTVTLGTRFGDRVEVLDGLSVGESIVASGVFLIDSESRLRASGGTGHAHGGSGTSSAASPGADAVSATHQGHEAGPPAPSAPEPEASPPAPPVRAHEASPPAPSTRAREARPPAPSVPAHEARPPALSTRGHQHEGAP